MGITGRPLGPGPGAYALPPTVGYPQHDATRYRNPMYSFGADLRYVHRQIGPGPTYKLDRVTKDGVMTSPAWSFGSRFPYRSVMRAPGPGAHAPERCPVMKEARPPAYSMAARLGYEPKRSGPAANAYVIRLGPGTPAYTMGGRVRFSEKTRSPGPAVYFQRDQEVYKFRPPKFSLGARLAGTGKLSRTPGPAAYPPGLYNTKKKPAAFSFATRHADWAPPMIIDEDTMNCL